jgi:hypothetical protein
VAPLRVSGLHNCHSASLTVQMPRSFTVGTPCYKYKQGHLAAKVLTGDSSSADGVMTMCEVLRETDTDTIMHTEYYKTLSTRLLPTRALRAEI